MGSRDLEARGVERPVARHESTRIPEDLKIPGTPRHRYLDIIPEVPADMYHLHFQTLINVSS